MCIALGAWMSWTARPISAIEYIVHPDAGPRHTGRIELGDGVAVVLGATSSGKTTVLEAIQAALHRTSLSSVREPQPHRVTVELSEHLAEHVAAVLEGEAYSIAPISRPARLHVSDGLWSVETTDPERWTAIVTQMVRRVGREPGHSDIADGVDARAFRQAAGVPSAVLVGTEPLPAIDLVEDIVESVLGWVGTRPSEGEETPAAVRTILSIINTRAAELLPGWVAFRGELVVGPAPQTWRSKPHWARVALKQGDDQVDVADMGAAVRRWVSVAVGLAATELAEVLDGPPDGATVGVEGRAVGEYLTMEWWEADSHFGLVFDDGGGPDAEPTSTDDVLRWMRDLPPPRRDVLLFDEPELHLHPAAQRSTAEWLVARAVEHPGVIAVTHSPALLSVPSQLARIYYMPGSGQPLREVTRDVLGELDAAPLADGFGRDAWMYALSGVLLVEGQHDLEVIDHFFGERLVQHRIRVFPMRGGRNWKSIAESDFMSAVGVPLFFLFDNVRLDTVEAAPDPSQLRDEERWCWQLLRLRDAGRPVDVLPYSEPDVMCAIPPAAFIRAYPHLDSPLRELLGDDVASWDPAIAEYRTLDAKTSFKTWVLRERLGFTKPPAKVVSAAIGSLVATDGPSSHFHRAIATLIARV